MRTMSPIVSTRKALAHAGRHHSTPPAVLSLTQATERGTLYRPSEISELAEIARDAGLSVHMDGARVANAVAALGVAPADLTWRAGVDALSLGGTKGGCLAAEAVVVFDPAKADGLRERRARSGHLLSKSRYLAAQYLAWLGDGLWLDLAGRANAAAGRLAQGLAAAGVEVIHSAEINMVWAILPEEADRRFTEAGARYRVEAEMAAGPLVRLVCDWSTTEAEVDAFLDILRGGRPSPRRRRRCPFPRPIRRAGSRGRARPCRHRQPSGRR